MTGAISWVAGLEGIPDAVTWIGGSVVMSGVWVIMVGQAKREREEERMRESINHGVVHDGVLETEFEMPDSQVVDTHNPLYVIDDDDCDDEELEESFAGLENTSSHALKGNIRGNAKLGRTYRSSVTQ